MQKLKNKAFTLIEVIIGVTLMAVVLVAIAGLILSTLFANQRNIQSVQAVALAQEGLEVIRYIRDSNWLQNYAWDQGQRTWGANFGDETELFLEENSKCPPCWGFGTEEEVITMEDGLKYSRSILVEPIVEEGFELEDQWKITALVEWKHRRNDRKVELSTYLSNWQ